MPVETLGLRLDAGGFVFSFRMFDLVSKVRILTSLRDRVAWTEVDATLWTSLHFIGELAFALSFFCLLNWALQHEAQGGFRQRGWQAFAAVGRISYSLYLTHVPVIYALEKWVPFGNEPWEWIVRYVTYATTTLLVWLVFYRLVESWFLSPAARAVPVAASSGERPNTERGDLTESASGVTGSC